jgi:uncharacterized membrane protein
LNGGLDIEGLAFDIPGGTATVVMVAIALAVVVALDVRSAMRAGGRRALFAILRALTGLGAFLIAIQPVWLTEKRVEREGELVVLVDGSRSMSIADRRAATEGLLARWAAEPVAGNVSVFRFAAGLEPATFETAATPNGDDTRIFEAIDELLAGDPDRRIGAVVVVSDGADRSGRAPEAVHGVRVHTVAVGEGSLRDDALVSVDADALGFLREPLRVHVVVRSRGGSSSSLPVQLRDDSSVLDEALVSFGPDGTAEADLEFVPERLGRNVLRVTIPTAEDDRVPENNERAFLVRVVRDRLRVLLVAGEPSWDERYLRRFLKRDPAIDLISFFILRTSADLTMADPDELALIPFPTDELFREHLGSFDLVIFQNFDFAPYEMAGYLPAIADYVRRGGSFAMLGGELSFASGNYVGSPIESILPVEMPRGVTGDGALVLGSFVPSLVAELSRHPLVALLPDAAHNREAWARLAPLEGMNRLEGTRNDALVLLEHPHARTRSGAPQPVLAVGEAGRGRTLSLATDTAWRWGITTAGTTGDASAYDRFWDRALRWLSRDPSLDPVRVTTDRERYGPGAEVRVEALLRDRRYLPIASEDVKLTITGPTGDTFERAEGRTDSEGNARARLAAPERPGGYRVVVSRGSETLGEEPFVVEVGGDELAEPDPRPDVLGALSESTGGDARAIGDAPALGSFATSRTESAGYERFSPFASLIAIGLLLLLFGAEWILRRRSGLR